jgi:hypothetical protein
VARRSRKPPDIDVAARVDRETVRRHELAELSPGRCVVEAADQLAFMVSFSHHVLFNGFKRFSKSYSNSERAALFHDTAVRAYRISDVG